MSGLTLAVDWHLSTFRVYWCAHRLFSELAELAVVLGVTSTGSVQKTLEKLLEAKFLKRVGSRYALTETIFIALPVGPARAGHTHGVVCTLLDAQLAILSNQGQLLPFGP